VPLIVTVYAMGLELKLTTVTTSSVSNRKSKRKKRTSRRKEEKKKRRRKGREERWRAKRKSWVQMPKISRMGEGKAVEEGRGGTVRSVKGKKNLHARLLLI
jgi:hypothetical protein